MLVRETIEMARGSGCGWAVYKIQMKPFASYVFNQYVFSYFELEEMTVITINRLKDTTFNPVE